MKQARVRLRMEHFEPLKAYPRWENGDPGVAVLVFSR